MAIDLPPPPVAALKERTRSVLIETPLGGPYRAIVQRQRFPCDEAGEPSGPVDTNFMPIARNFDDVEAETVTLADNTVLTAAQVAEAISLFADAWAIETPPEANQ